MNHTDEQHRQKRTHLKVRTGCATCKTRRVKCDEAHPVCVRCRNAKRECVYAVPKTWLFEPKKELIGLPSQLSLTYGNLQEKRAFQFFVEKTAPQFSGNHDLAQKFWNNFVVTTAIEDPLIFRLAVAMGACHEAAVLGSQQSSKLAATSHAVVISTMARQLTTMRVDLSLLCCALLMGYANLCEEVPATAAIHFSLGLKILREETIPGRRGLSDAIGAYINPMFAELELATALFRVPTCDVEMIVSERYGYPSMPKMPLAFTNLYEAKQTLADIHRWMLYATIMSRSSCTGHQSKMEQVDRLLLQWRQGVVAYAASAISRDLLSYHKARKMLFQYKLFVMCSGAAKNQVFKDACRVQMVSVDFTQPDLTSVLCTLNNSLMGDHWTPLSVRNEREKDDLDIWPKGEPAGDDGGSQVIRITLGSYTDV